MKDIPFADVYVSRLTGTIKQETLYPYERISEIAACRNAKTQAQKIAVWELLAFAMRHSLGVEIGETDIHRNENGKWVCGDCWFSLSHSDRTVAVAISDHPVGVDVEAVGRARHGIFERIATDREKIACPSLGNEEIIRLWTAKESIFKMQGGKSFLPHTIECAEQPVRSYFSEDFCEMLSVCGTGIENATLYRVAGSPWQAEVIK